MSAASPPCRPARPRHGLLARQPVLDGHNDLLWAAREAVGHDFDRLDIAAGTAPTTPTSPRCAAVGVGAQFWSVFVPATSSRVTTRSAPRWSRSTPGTRWWPGMPRSSAFARTADEVEAAWKSGADRLLLGAEGGHSINCSLATLRMLHVLGVRYLTLTHNSNVPWADSATDEPAAGGLSRFGVEVVREMNRIGMLVDLSHVSADTMRDALRASEVPGRLPHSSARAVCDSPRNAPDDVLETLRVNGGVCW